MISKLISPKTERAFKIVGIVIAPFKKNITFPLDPKYVIEDQ